MNLKEVMDMLGHSYVTLLKVRSKQRKRRRQAERIYACVFQFVYPLIHILPLLTFLPLSSPLRTHLHDQADIEGFEFDLFNELLTVDEVELPEQISFELHYITIVEELPWMPRQKTAGEIALLGTRLYEQGYRVLSREDNVYVPL